MTKGERLHNPFDIEKSNIEWLGMVKPGADAVFCEFIDDLHGLRAGYVDIKVAIHNGKNTIRRFITPYAPPSENNTAAYIKHVCDFTGLNPDAQLSDDNIKELGKAVLIEEQGHCNYTDDLINQALEMAGVKTNAKTTVIANNTKSNGLFNHLWAIFRDT